jgi:hypothetical protein
MWVLVYIVLIGEPRMAVIEPTYKTINECFLRREMLLVQMDLYSGKFPNGITAICVHKKLEDRKE